MSTTTSSPFQRVRESDAKSASVLDLIATGFARRDENPELLEAMARKVWEYYGSIQRLADASTDDVKRLAGLDGYEITRVKALLELGRRAGVAAKGVETTIDGIREAVKELDYLRDRKQEHFVVISLDAKNKVIRKAEIHKGTLTSSLVGPREVFREAIREGACSIIVAHNHPSGDPEPSPEDRSLTAQLVEIGRMLDIPVHDHIIVGSKDFLSMRERGYM